MFAEELSHPEHYGWTIEGKRFDWAALRDFVNADVDRLEGLYGKTLENNKVAKYLERATVTGPHSVRLASGKEFTAKYILVAVGSWPMMPEFPGVEHCISSNEIFHLEHLPKRLVIVGAGYIAMEFAGIFNALGCHVSMINRTQTILRDYDHSIVERLLHIAMLRGIDFHMNSQIKGVEKGDDGCLLVDIDGDEILKADQVLIATGRRAEHGGLGA